MHDLTQAKQVVGDTIEIRQVLSETTSWIRETRARFWLVNQDCNDAAPVESINAYSFGRLIEGPIMPLGGRIEIGYPDAE